MAFAIRDLSVLAYANGFTLWHYKVGEDLTADTCENNFFADARDMMAPGDIIMVTGATSGALRMVTAADVSGLTTIKLT